MPLVVFHKPQSTTCLSLLLKKISNRPLRKAGQKSFFMHHCNLPLKRMTKPFPHNSKHLTPFLCSRLMCLWGCLRGGTSQNMGKNEVKPNNKSPASSMSWSPVLNYRSANWEILHINHPYVHFGLLSSH